MTLAPAWLPALGPRHVAVWAAVAALLLLAQLVALARRDRRDAVAAATGLAGAASAVVLLRLLVPPQAIPLDWLAILHEGGSDQDVAHLYGRGHHAGPAFTALLDAVAGPGLRLRSVVHLNLQLAAAQAVAFAVIAFRTAPRPWQAGLVALAFVLNPVFLQASLAETPAPLLGCLAMAAAVAARGMAVGGRFSRATGAALLAWLAVLALLVRPEVGAVLAVAAVVGGLRLAVGDARLQSQAGRAGLALRRGLDALLARPALALLVVATGLLAWAAMPADSLEVRLVVDGLHPLNTNFLSLPFAVAELLPAGMALLVVAGTVAGLARPVALLGLPVTVLVLYRVYFSASHGVWYELLRYLTLLLPWLGLLALYGWHGLERACDRLGWTGLARRRARAAAALLFVVWLPHGAVERFGRADGGPRATVAAWLQLDGEVQREVRFLQAAVDRHPGCIFVTRVLDRPQPGRAPAASLLWFGAPLRGPRSMQRLDGDLAGARLADVPAEACLLVYRSLDCHRVDGQGCEDLVAGRPAVATERFWYRPYSHPAEHGVLAAEIELGLFRVR